MADGHEDAGDGEGAFFTGNGVGKRDSLDGLLALNSGHGGVPRETYFLVGKETVLHDFRGAQFVAAVNKRDRLGKLCKKKRFFYGRIAAANNGDVVIAEEKSIAGGTGREAMTEKTGFLFKPEHE